MIKFLLIEDDVILSDTIKEIVMELGEVTQVYTGNEGLYEAESGVYDLIVLDLMLPEMNGYQVLAKLRKQGNQTPVLILTAKDGLEDKIEGFQKGADDYLTKPFSPRELTARVKAVLRRGAKDNQAGGELVVGTLRFNLISYEAFIGREKMELTPKEYELLKLFASNIGKAFTREELLEKVWGYEYYGDTRTVDVHVRHLRIKMGNSPELCDAIETVRGVGYKFRNH